MEKRIGFLSFGHWQPIPGSQVRTGAGRAACRPSSSPSPPRSSARRRLRAGAPLRPPAGLAVPAAGRHGRAHQPDRARHRRHRHALREPALHGRGGCGGRPAQRRPAAARRQPGITGDGAARLGGLRVRAAGGLQRRRPGAGEDGAVPRRVARRDRRRRRPADDRGRGRAAARSSRSRPGLADRIWWGSGTRATGRVDGGAGDEPDELDPAGRGHRRALRRAAGRADRPLPRRRGPTAGWEREPRVSVSRSVLPIVTDLDRAVLRRRAVRARTRSASWRACGRGSARATSGSPTASPRSWPRTPPCRRPTPCC